MSKEVTFEEIETARNQIAQIISLHGEKYLPIFERLDNEYNARKAQQALLTKAKEIANGINED